MCAKPIAVAIVNHNTCKELHECLATIGSQDPVQVIVVDNASSDGSIEMLHAEYPGVTVCRNDTNLGYGAAANQAIFLSKSKYILLLNSDTLLPPDALQALGNYLDQNPRAAVVGPRLLNSDGTLQPSCFPFPTPPDILLDVSNLARLVHHIPFLRDHYLRTWSHSRARRVPWVLGAALAIRREAFDTVGGFDESFFMYYEEADLCYRLRTTGWQIHFAPVTEIIHVGGASTRQRYAHMKVQFFASLLQFYRRHYSGMEIAELTALIECVALTRFVRDTISLRLTADSQKRANLAANIEAWRRLILGHWGRQAAWR